MRLTLQSQTMDDVVVIRCRGRIVAGTEAEALQVELERQTQIPGTNLLTVKWVVLQLAEVDYIDSSGLGALVRVFSALQAAGGGLRLCQVSPFVLKVLQITKLVSMLPTHSSEEEAIEAFCRRSPHEAIELSRTKIVCIDTSRDLLAYVRALLASSGYEVHTASNLADAKSLVSAINPKVVICGAGMLELPTGEAVVEGISQRPNVQILRLPSDFSTAEAGQAGLDLVNHVQSLLTT
jgi:anti-anti-sigma factor